MVKKLKILELGAGANPYVTKKNETVIHVDIVKLPHIDLVYDLNKSPWPFKDNEFDKVIGCSILEHLDDVVKTINEIWRITKNGGKVEILVPYFVCADSFTDPTHKHFFTTRSLDYWDKNTEIGKKLGFEMGHAQFKIKNKKILFGSKPLSKIKFLHALVNKHQHFYEVYASRILPASAVYFELLTIK